MYGRQEWAEEGNKKIYPQQIQRGLYEDFDTASMTTGYFRLKNENGLVISVQLKKGVEPTESLKIQFQKAALKYVDTDLPIILYPYQNFSYGVGLDYERKFKYI